MEAPIIIEILDRFGKIRERHKINQFPIRIGRAYSNDIILDDNYISPEHIELLIDGDGHVLISDLQSENGLFTLHPIQKRDLITAEDDQRIRIGHTDIRIRSENYPSRKTYIDHGKPSILHFLLTNGFILPFIWLILAGITASYYYLQSSKEMTSHTLLVELLPIFVFVCIWALGWSVVSKAVTRKFYFSYHAILVSLVVCAFYIIESGFEYIEFLFPISDLSSHLSILSDLGFTALLLYGHLRQSTNLNKKHQRLTAIASTVIIVGLLNLTTYLNQPEFTNQPVFSYILKPPAFAIRKAKSIDGFFANTENLTKFNIKPERDTKSDSL